MSWADLLRRVLGGRYFLLFSCNLFSKQKIQIKNSIKMKKELFTKMVLITPESAKELLKLNVSNRPLNKVTVDWYAKQMTNGQWTISGQTISISDKNTLIDGQHRLAALVKSGKEIMFNVAYNVPFQSFVNYDSVRSRGLSDVFAIENIPNYKNISAIISKYNAFMTGNMSNMGFSDHIK